MQTNVMVIAIHIVDLSVCIRKLNVKKCFSEKYLKKHVSPFKLSQQKLQNRLGSMSRI